MKNFRRFIVFFSFALMIISLAFTAVSCGNENKSDPTIYIVTEDSFKANAVLTDNREISDVSLKSIKKSNVSQLEVGQKYYALVYVYNKDVASARLEISVKGELSLDKEALSGTISESKLSVAENQGEPNVFQFSRATGEKSSYYVAVGFKVEALEESEADYKEGNLNITFSCRYSDGKKELKDYSVSLPAVVSFKKQASAYLSVKYLGENGEPYETLNVEDKSYIYPYEKIYVEVECTLKNSLKAEEAATAILSVSTQTQSKGLVDIVVDELPTSEYSYEDDAVKAPIKVYDSGDGKKEYLFRFYLISQNDVGTLTVSVNLYGENISVLGEKSVSGKFYVNESMRNESRLDYTLSDDGTYYIVTGIGEENGDRIRIPDKHNGLPVKEIADRALQNITYIKEVILPKSLVRIGHYAFKGCAALESVVIPLNVKTVGVGAFDKCTNASLCCVAKERPSGWAGLWASLYDSCIIWDCETMFKKTEDRKSYVFMYNGYDLTTGKLIIPENYLGYKVTSVKVSSHVNTYFQETIWSLKIPKSVTLIDDPTEFKMENLRIITVDEGNPKYQSANNCLIDKTTKTLILAGNESVIPEDGSVIYIGVKAFYCTIFNQSDKWFDGALYIGKYLINVNDELVSGAFKVKEGTVCIANDALSGCNNITSITVPDSVKVIGSRAFCGCSKIKNITLPSSVTDIGSEAFAWCTYLKTVNILGKIKSISDRMFENCARLTDIVIPGSVKVIGKWAFRECTALTSIIVPEGVTGIGKGAFEHCVALTSIIIPDSVTSIGEKTFADCTALASIKYRGTEEQWKSISKGAFWDEASPYENNKLGFTVTYNYKDE